ncbi:DUF4169 family protein [Azospirillaceae bacterium]
MGDVVNLNRRRKAQERLRQVEQAAANRVFYGQTKEERLRRQKEQSRLDRFLDGCLQDAGPSKQQ